ncbi:hypothetical protein AgCh_013579 [Apium graveolens]
MDQSMAYLARKFSNIRVKKPRFFKGKGLSSNSNNWKLKTQYNSVSKGGYKTGSMDISKIRQAYIELEAKYEALLKKQSRKAYIAEGKSWDDTDVDDEDEKVGNYALMDFEHEEASTSKSKVPTLTTIDLNASQYKETVEKMSVEMNASELVGQYHEKNKPCANIAIGLDYDALNINKKNVSGKGKGTENEDVPVMLRKVGTPMFKACEIDFSEEELIIKQEIADEDNVKKNVEITPISKTEKKLMVNQDSNIPVKEVKIEDARKKGRIEMGRLG